MCYDLSFSTSIESIFDYFPDMVNEDLFKVHFDATVHIVGHAYGEHPVIYHNPESQQIQLKLMEWGCIPFYTKDEKAFLRQRASMLNARSERILGDPKSYWYKIRNRRCLIPASGIYEHRMVPTWKKKVPYFVRMKEAPLFFLPGLYSVAELPDKETGELIRRWTFTLVTRPANALMQLIHNDGDNKWRMPLFLTTALAREWVSPDLSPERMQALLDFCFPAEALECWPVFTIRSPKPRPDSKRKDEHYAWEQLPALEDAQP